MRENEFRRFLTDSTEITSKDKAVNSRISKASKVEKDLHVNLDTIVKDDMDTYLLLLRIQNEMHEVSGNYQNAVRKYYLFINGKKFPRILTFEQENNL